MGQDSQLSLVVGNLVMLI